MTNVSGSCATPSGTMSEARLAEGSNAAGKPAAATVAASCFTVFVCGEIFGLPVEHAQTIFRIGSVTPIPLGPPEIAGLVNLRGKVVTAVSLRCRLGLPVPVSFKNALAIGIDYANDSFALVVDGIGDVLPLPAAARIPMPPHFDQERAAYTSEIYNINGLLIPILDVAVLLGIVSSRA